MTPFDALDGTAPASAPGGDARHWAEVAAAAADDKLAVDTVIVDVGEVLAVTDLFVITSGTNPRQVRAIVDEVEARVAERGGPRPVRVEGRDTREWVLLDYGAFVVHVFDEKTRAHYQLERLWGDRPRWHPGRPSTAAPGS